MTSMKATSKREREDFHEENDAKREKHLEGMFERRKEELLIELLNAHNIYNEERWDLCMRVFKTIIDLLVVEDACVRQRLYAKIDRCYFKVKDMTLVKEGKNPVEFSINERYRELFGESFREQHEFIFLILYLNHSTTSIQEDTFTSRMQSFHDDSDEVYYRSVESQEMYDANIKGHGVFVDVFTINKNTEIKAITFELMILTEYFTLKQEQVLKYDAETTIDHEDIMEDRDQYDEDLITYYGSFMEMTNTHIDFDVMMSIKLFSEMMAIATVDDKLIIGNILQQYHENMRLNVRPLRDKLNFRDPTVDIQEFELYLTVHLQEHFASKPEGFEYRTTKKHFESLKKKV